MVSEHGDVRRAGHGNHTKPSVTKLAHPLTLGGDSDDPITLRLCVTCPPATLEPKANWVGGSPPHIPSQQTNRPGKQVPTTPASKQLPTVTVWLVLISHKDVVHEALLSLSLSSFKAKFPTSGSWPPRIVPRIQKTGNPNKSEKIVVYINTNNSKCVKYKHV